MTPIRAALCSLGLFFCSFVFAEYPEKPIRLIVPTNAGGEIDTMARIFERAFYDFKLLSKKMVVVNKPGAGGTLGTREVLEADPDGYTICLWHPGIVTSKAMGVVDFDHSDFEIICTTGHTETALGFKRGERITDAKQALEFVRENPNELTVSTNMGLPVHFVPLLFAKELGVEFKFVQSGGGAKRLASLLGGHSDVAFFSTMAFQDGASSDLQPLLLFSAERNADFPGVPTARELGADVVVAETRIWLAPKGTPLERIDVLRTAVKAALAEPSVSGRFEQMGVEPRYGEAEALDVFLTDFKDRVTPLVPEAQKLDPLDSLALPHFVAWVIAFLLAGLGVRGWLRLKNRKGAVADEGPAYKKEPGLAVGIVVLAAVYTGILSLGWVSFAWASLVFVSAAGAMIGRWNARIMATSFLLALVIGFGGQYLFTEIFSVDLPR
ncbi:MAG: tripartite tricarboxylate transporter substrate binding protein [Verrucomicrobiota bacterium]